MTTWGAACSALQCEGAAPASDWARRERVGVAPQSGDGNGFRTTYAEDVALLAEHGLAALRLTVEWARLEPRRGEWDVAEVDRYLATLRAARAAGLEVWVTLHHLTLPGWFSEDERGFRDERMARRVWPAHVDRVAEVFGDLVAGWIPVDQPSAYAALAWADQDDRRAGLRELRAANRQAARLLRSASTPVITSHPPDEPVDELKLDLEVFDGLGFVHAATDGHELEHALDRLVERTGTTSPVHLTGIGVGTQDPDEQADKARGAREQVEGADAEVGLALWWSAVDGYEPTTGFSVPWGLFDRDRNARPAVEVWAAQPRER